MIKSGRLTITTAPQSLVYGESIDSIRGQTITIKNLDATNSVYLGGAVRSLGTLSLLATGIGATSALQAAVSWKAIR